MSVKTTPLDPAAALRELRALVGTYLEGSDDALRAAELLDALESYHRARGRMALKLAIIRTLKERSVGIPYAPQQLDPAAKRWFVECPICGARIDLLVRKDFESFTGQEYQEHVAKEHPDA